MSENSENNSAAVKKRGLKFYLKVLVTFICLIVLSGGIAVYYVYYRLTTDSRFEQLLMKKVGDTLQMQVRFEKLEFAFPGFSIINAGVATDSHEMKLDAAIGKIAITPDFWAAFNGQLILDSFSISSASINLERKKAAAVAAASESVAATATFDASRIAFPFNSFYADSVRLNFTDRVSAQQHSIQLRRASLERSLLSASLPFNVDLGVEKHGDIKLNGHLYWPDTVKFNASVHNVDLKQIATLIPAEYQRHLQPFSNPRLNLEGNFRIADNSLKISAAELQIDPGIKVNATVDLAKLQPLNGLLTLKVAPVALPMLLDAGKDFVPADLGLVVEKGSIAVELEMALQDSQPGAMRVLITPRDVKLKAKMLPEALTIDSGRAEFDGQKLKLSAIRAALAETSAEMTTGELVLQPVSFNGQIKASADFDRIWPKLLPLLPENAQRVTPSGKAAFNGSIKYAAAKIALSGDLDSASLKLKEQTTQAGAELENIKIKFVDAGPTSGKIEILSLKVKGAGGNVAVNGNITNSADPGFAMKAEGAINLADFSALAASIFKLPVQPQQFAGELGINLSLGGTLSDLQPEGTINFKNIKADMKERGLVLSELNGVASADPKKLEIKDLSAVLAGGRLKLNGSIRDFKKPQVAADAAIAGIDLKQVFDFIRLNFPEMPAELKVSGSTDMTVKVSGPIAEPKVEGSSSLKAVSFFHPAVFRPIENITGPVVFDNSGLTTSGIEAKWGTSAAVVKGSLKNWGKLISDFSYEVKPLDATDAAGFFLKETGYKLVGSGTGSGKVTGELEKIRVSGKAVLPQGQFSAPISETNKDEFKFPFTNLQTSFNFFAGIFTIESGEADLFKGKVKASGKIDLNEDPIKYDFAGELNQVETSEFLRENTSFSKALRGGLDGKGQITGTTVGLASIDGTASLLMKEGAYSSPPVVQKICEQLNAPHLASGTIQNVSGDYKISGGRISSNNTMAKSKDGKMTYVGSVGLDTSLDGTMNVEINRAACQQSSVLKQLVGNEEMLAIPVTLKGSLTSPSVGIPLDKMLKDAAAKQVKKAIEKQAGDALGKIFGKKKEPETASPTAQTEVKPDQSVPAETKKEPVNKKIENKIKEVGKDLKKIFKF